MEAILPLDHNTKWMDDVAGRLANVLINKSNNDNTPININLNDDGKTIANIEVKADKKAKKHKGKGLFD